VTFPPEIVRTLTPSDSKCEMSSECASPVPKCFVNLCEGRSYGKGESMNRDYLWRKPLTDSRFCSKKSRLNLWMPFEEKS
jgi:hypothetical protein